MLLLIFYLIFIKIRHTSLHIHGELLSSLLVTRVLNPQLTDEFRPNRNRLPSLYISRHNTQLVQMHEPVVNNILTSFIFLNAISATAFISGHKHTSMHIYYDAITTRFSGILKFQMWIMRPQPRQDLVWFMHNHFLIILMHFLRYLHLNHHTSHSYIQPLTYH